MSLNLGYCCINETLRHHQGIYSGRSLQSKTFSMEKAALLGLQNVQDLLTILQWNNVHNIKVFRIGSEPLPRANDPRVGYHIDDLSTAAQIRETLAEVGRYAYQHGHHLSFHPGQYVCIGSPNEITRIMGIRALKSENEVADALCRDVPLDIPINIHVGGSYGGDFSNTAQRFCDSFAQLPKSLQLRLCVENDDKKACWSVRSLYDFIHQRIGIPITFDLHHYNFCNDGHSPHEDFLLAQSTWCGRSMQVHYSQSPTAEKLIPSHSDYYRDPLPSWINQYKNIHIHLECKAKELALFKYRQDVV